MEKVGWLFPLSASVVLQKEQLILGSGRVGLRNVGNTVRLLPVSRESSSSASTRPFHPLLRPPLSVS